MVLEVEAVLGFRIIRLLCLTLGFGSQMTSHPRNSTQQVPKQPTLQTLVLFGEATKPTFRKGVLVLVGRGLKIKTTFPHVRTQKPSSLRFSPMFLPLTLRPTCHAGNVATFTL